MIDERDPNGLSPEFRPYYKTFLRLCKEEYFPVLIYCYRRSLETQAKEFRKSRTKDEIDAKAQELEIRFGRPDLAAVLINVGPQQGKLGAHSTYAGPGQSPHNYGMAFDGAPLDENGNIDWEYDELWVTYTEIAKDSGLITLDFERPHCQMPDFKWSDHIRTYDFSSLPSTDGQDKLLERHYKYGWNAGYVEGRKSARRYIFSEIQKLKDAYTA